MNKICLIIIIIVFSGCELLFLLKDGNPQKEEFKLYEKGFINTSNFPRLDGIYVWGVKYEGQMRYRYYRFYERGQVFYGFLNSLELVTDSLPINFKEGQKGYYQLYKRDFLKLEMFANGYRFYYLVDADINSTADTIRLRKSTRRDGSKEKRLNMKFVFIDKTLFGNYPDW